MVMVGLITMPSGPIGVADASNDGVGNNADTDDDGDGARCDDTFPLDPQKRYGY